MRYVLSFYSDNEKKWEESTFMDGPAEGALAAGLSSHFRMKW